MCGSSKINRGQLTGSSNLYLFQYFFIQSILWLPFSFSKTKKKRKKCVKISNFSFYDFVDNPILCLLKFMVPAAKFYGFLLKK